MLCSTTSVCNTDASNTDASNTDASNTGFISGIVIGAVIGILGFLAALYLKRRQGEKTRAIGTQSEGIQSLLKHITSVYQANLDNKVSPEQFNGIVEQARELAKKYGKTFRIDLDTALDGLKALATSQTTTNIDQSKEHAKSEPSDQIPETQKNIDINTDTKTVRNTSRANDLQITSGGEEYSFKRKLVAEGSADGQFNRPAGIDVDSEGNVYVADSENHRIQKYKSDGTFIKAWGSKGIGNGRFNNPNGIAIDSLGYVYVVDTNNYRVQKFDSDGEYIPSWKTTLGENYEYLPASVAVDSSSGDVYITGEERYDLVKDSTGTTVSYRVNYNLVIQKFDSDGTFITKWGKYGTADGQFRNPSDITINSKGLAYVTDSDNNSVQVFASNLSVKMDQ
jgi:sugar lactone lactonase YvrE